MSDISDDKNKCFQELNIQSHHRNILSYGLFGCSNVAMLVLTSYKITHPAIFIGLSVVNSVAQWLKTNNSSSKHKEIIRLQQEELRRLSIQELDDLSKKKPKINSKEIKEIIDTRFEFPKSDDLENNNIELDLE